MYLLSLWAIVETDVAWAYHIAKVSPGCQ